MQKDGYEIATGGGDILVFRRSTNTSPSATMTNNETASSIRQDSYLASHSTTQPASPSSSKANSSPRSTSKRGIFRRIMFAGTATAASCYAIGAVTEFFRTGGLDGKGIDGFTVFESDRRRE